MKKSILIVSLFFFWCQYSLASDDSTKVEVHSLKDFFQKGAYHVHVRMRGMSTFNEADLKDFAALGIGGGLAYYSPEWKNIHLGMSGFFAFRLWSTDLSPDPLTNAPNRYEIMLFDATDAENSSDLDRMEELYLKYSPGHMTITLGRQYLNTPLLNGQDNRMRPNIFEALMAEWHSTDHWHFTAAWISKISPRGTVEWYGMGESIGIYNAGRYLNGQPSNYFEHESSRGLALSGVDYNRKDLHLFAWNYHADNLFNTTFLQGEWQLRKNWEWALQGLYQIPLKNGGNIDPEKSYIHSHDQIWMLGSSLRYFTKKHHASINYLRISEGGRFLFPREWGREQLFTNLPRDRFEGSGGLHSAMLKYTYFPHSHWDWAVGTSVNALPDENDFIQNKYGLSSYVHYYSSFNYHFSGSMEGLNMHLVGVYKQSLMGEELSQVNRVNKVNMAHVDIVLDYHF